jgi:hypothetical protein
MSQRASPIATPERQVLFYLQVDTSHLGSANSDTSNGSGSQAEHGTWRPRRRFSGLVVRSNRTWAMIMIARLFLTLVSFLPANSNGLLK